MIFDNEDALNMATQSLNLPPVGTCPRAKRRYHSRLLALAHADHLRSIGLHQPERGELHAYMCERCDSWHIGHRLTGGE